MQNHKPLTESFARAVARTQPRAYNGPWTWEALISGPTVGWLKLAIDVPADTIQREIQAAQHLFVPHRFGYASQGWSSFCLYGRSVSATREEEHYQGDQSMSWTPETQELMPETIEWLRTQWPHSKFGRVRMMQLEPGGWIGVHKDYARSRLGPVNIAITQPEACDFYMEHAGIVPFAVGTAMWVDVGRWHAVINRSDQPRWHMIIHQQEEDPGFRRLVEDSITRS